MAKIVVIGSLNMDVVAACPRLPGPGETLLGTQYFNEPGGKGGNQAYAAAKLGGDVAMLGRVGSDDHGRRLITNLAEAGCDISRVKPIESPSGVAVILVAESGVNSIVVVPGANGRYLPSDLYADAHRLADTHLSLLQLEIPIETVIAAAQISKRCGARVILDPAPAPVSPPSELFKSIDILTPNEVEATSLIGVPAEALTVEEARAVAAQLQAAGAPVVILKLGAQGCLLAEREIKTWVPARRVAAVDTTAAGDVFNGALAVACSEGASLEDACRFAVSAAALSVTRLGAQRSMPGRDELANYGKHPGSAAEAVEVLTDTGVHR